MSALKPCSNCGTKPSYTSSSVAVCDNIKCTGRNMVERWNDRPIEDALQAENERLKEGVKTVLKKIDDACMDNTFMITSWLEDILVEEIS